jgi:hypothetical protein
LDTRTLQTRCGRLPRWVGPRGRRSWRCWSGGLLSSRHLHTSPCRMLPTLCGQRVSLAYTPSNPPRDFLTPYDTVCFPLIPRQSFQVCIYIHACIRMHAYIDAYIHTYVYTYPSIHPSIRPSLSLSLSLYIYIYTYIHTHTHTHTHTYIHTYVPKYINIYRGDWRRYGESSRAWTFQTCCGGLRR